MKTPSVTPTTEFVIVCKKCDKEKRMHNTLLYVDWEKRYYMITCQTCNTIEAFDEFSNKIDLSKEPIKEKEDEDGEGGLQSN